MKLTISKRNQIVEEHLWCIDAIISKNAFLLGAAHLERDDVYQDLAMRLIQAVTDYTPKRGNLNHYILAQLKQEMLSCQSSKKCYGIRGLPYYPGVVISLDMLLENNLPHIAI